MNSNTCNNLQKGSGYSFKLDCNLPGGQPEVVTYNNCKQTELPSQQAPAEVVGVSSDNLSPIEQVAEEQTGGRSKKRRRRRRRSRRGKKNSRRSRKASRNGGGGIIEYFKKKFSKKNKVIENTVDESCKFPFYNKVTDSDDQVAKKRLCELLDIMNVIYKNNQDLEEQLENKKDNIKDLYNEIKFELALKSKDLENNPGQLEYQNYTHQYNQALGTLLDEAYNKYNKTQQTQTPVVEKVEGEEQQEEEQQVGETRLNKLKQQIGGATNVQEIVEIIEKFEKEKTQKAGKRNKKSNRRKRKGKRKLRTSRKRTLKNKRRRKSRRRQQGGYNYDCPSCNMSGRDFGCKQPLWNSKCI